MREVLYPVGRLLPGGSLYKLFQQTDDDNKPKFETDGTTPVLRCNFGVAIPKTSGVPDWKNEPWGQQLLAEAQFGFPDGEWQHPAFAWKVNDGDSLIPNKNKKVPANQVGQPGNWVIWFSQSWLPKLCNSTGTSELTEPNAILPGYFVQVLGSVKKNTGKSPGLYQNPVAVALSGYGTPFPVSTDVDTSKVGFGQAPLPAGASATPVAGMTQPAPVAAAAVQMPPIPAQAAPAPLTTVAPNAAYMAPPPPATVAPAPPAAGPRILRNAQGQQADYAQMIANKWTDELLAAHGWIG